MTGNGPLLLVGGGHSHALVLKRWAMHPQRRPDVEVVLINRRGTALYSGMVPGLIAGIYSDSDAAIDLRRLCDQAGVAFVAAEAEGVDPDEQLLRLRDRPPLRYGHLSLNVGAISRPTAAGMPIKPLETALAFLDEQDRDSQSNQPFRVVGAGAAGIEVVLAHALPLAGAPPSDAGVSESARSPPSTGPQTGRRRAGDNGSGRGRTESALHRKPGT